MKRLVLFCAILAFAQMSIIPASAQLIKPNSGNNAAMSRIQGQFKRVENLKPADVDQATKVQYVLSAGSIAPEYWWNCSVTVTSSSVSLKVIGDNSVELYSESFSITQSQWSAFKQRLKNRHVRNDSSVEPLCGGHGGYLEVSNGKKTLFHADESDGLLYDDWLMDIFKPLVPEGKPQEILDDPAILVP